MQRRILVYKLIEMTLTTKISQLLVKHATSTVHVEAKPFHKIFIIIFLILYYWCIFLILQLFLIIFHYGDLLFIRQNHIPNPLT